MTQYEKPHRVFYKLMWQTHISNSKPTNSIDPGVLLCSVESSSSISCSSLTSVAVRSRVVLSSGRSPISDFILPTAVCSRSVVSAVLSCCIDSWSSLSRCSATSPLNSSTLNRISVRSGDCRSVTFAPPSSGFA